MFFAGVDIGSRATKVVILEDDRIISHAINYSGFETLKSAYEVLDKALDKASIGKDDLDEVVSTGYGRIRLPFASRNISDLASHARGLNWYYPEEVTLLDIGGQDIKAIQTNKTGRIVNFVMNDKCAGGTGRFLEIMADVLEVPLAETGELSLTSTKHVAFTSICVLFVKSQALTFMREGVPIADILAGVFDSVATQCANLLAKVGYENKIFLTGGVARNVGVVKKLQDKTGVEIVIPERPQLIGALGAAAVARKRFLNERKLSVA